MGLNEGLLLPNAPNWCQTDHGYAKKSDEISGYVKPYKSRYEQRVQ